jgi:hypothetical protein
MHPHLAKIATEARLEKTPLRFCQRLAAAFKGQDMRFEIGGNFRYTT